jgi:hypothetical protein
MSDFFKCDCKRVSIAEHTMWCHMSAHDCFEYEYGECYGHDEGERVHCTDYQVYAGDTIRCLLCNTRWVHEG